MGMLYGIAGMIALIAAYWIDETYTYNDGYWLVAASMGPGAALGLWSAAAVAMTSLPEMVGMYNGFGGLAAALTGYGLYLDPTATSLVRHGREIVDQTDAMLWVQAIALILSVVIGMMTFTGSCIAVLKLRGTLASKPRVIPMRALNSLLMFSVMAVFGALTFVEGWNDRKAGLAYLCVVGFVAALYGVVSVIAIGGTIHTYIPTHAQVGRSLCVSLLYYDVYCLHILLSFFSLFLQVATCLVPFPSSIHSRDSVPVRLVLCFPTRHWSSPVPLSDARVSF